MKTRTLTRRSRWGALALSFALTLACSGDDGGGETDGGGEEEDGQVYAPFDTLCVATFTAEATAVDVFDDTLFTIKSGERYLMKLDSFGVELLFLSSGGPIDFLVDAEAGAEPYTTNCQEDAVESIVGVFSDVTVYADLEGTSELCQLSAGTMWPSAGGGFNLESDLFDDPAIYSVSYEGLAEQCGGADTGYIQAEQIFALGSLRTPSPIALVSGPSA